MLIKKDDLRVFLPKNRNKLEYISFILLALVIITMPFFIQLNSLCVIVLFVLWLVSGKWKQKVNYFLAQPLLYIPILLFLLLLVSYTLSEDKVAGAIEVEKKLSLLAFPLIFSGNILQNQIQRNALLSLFVLTCISAAFICLGFAIIEYPKNGIGAFFYHQLGSPLNFHAVYFSCYISFCIIIVFISFIQKFTHLHLKHRVVKLLILAFLLFFLVLLSSKTILAATLLLMLFITLRLVMKFGTNLKILFGSATLVALFTIMILRTDYIKGRFNEIINENYKEVLSSEDYRYITFTGGTIRLAIWKSILEILNIDNAWLFGTGLGDTQNKLTQYYKKKNIYPGDEVLGFKGFIHYNAHNQYFEFLISTGVCGVVLFLIWLVALFYKAIRIRKTEWICFLILMCFFFLTESALNAHKGIMLFVLINLLYNIDLEKKIVNN